MKTRTALALLLPTLLAACAQAPKPATPRGHLKTEDVQAAVTPIAAPIPAPVQRSFTLPPPKPAVKADTYSVVVRDVDVRELLFALARDAKLNVDVHAGLAGRVTLNAINQTLPQLLERISHQVDMRYEQNGPNLVVMPDTPFLRAYKIDYVNISRAVTGTVATNTQIATQSGTAATTAQGGGNISSIRIENTSLNQFWVSIEKNIQDLLKETDKVLPATPATKEGDTPGGFREAASVIINRETGVINARATARQHARVRDFIDRVAASARRQVMIEATIVEVSLNDGYQQGIDWSHLGGTNFGFQRPSLGSNVGSSTTPFSITYLSNNLSIDIDLLEAFGTVKVLSSPRLSVLNNQTAMLKVVDEFVYFNVKAETVSTANVDSRTTFTTTPQSVSVGLVMSITPQVSDTGEITLNVRPTISSISDLKEDPNPNLAAANIKNLVPQIRTREIESVLRLRSGQVAVLGGLMEDRIDYKTGRVPLVGSVPLFGEVFTSRDNATQKTELVIFLRPIMVGDGPLPANLAEHLPDATFFARNPVPGNRNFDSEPSAPLPLRP
ncbi:pilus (MSHA type) biogenesis protein MshL [Denitromonas halophila]|uniref:Type IV pilus biogenesis and competence protein PilQ n=1 Tax=Denitromonas halophila TaxID=1629404 RepID=A0A557QX39_9RHOO|nr:pilus (MSHA type) biogenesis protein MshL [Denitromonas halophila]TVO57485.1 pilus (MSHA type) biogenesis protein MshL [Denitromonas halophila]